MSKLVKCSDRLPKKDDEVLVWDNSCEAYYFAEYSEAEDE